MITIPIGLSHQLAASWHLLAEIGVIVGVVRNRYVGDRTSISDDSVKTDDFAAGYGALAIAWTH